MSSIVVSVQNGEEPFDSEIPVSLNGFPEFTDVREIWIRRIYAQYRKTRGGGNSTEYVQIRFEPFPTKIQKIYQYQFDETFLDQLVSSYCYFGWPIIKALEEKVLNKSTPLTPAS